MALQIPRSLDNPWLDTDPTRRQEVVQAYRRWLWEHLETDRAAMEAGLDGGECDYGLFDPAQIAPDLPLDPEWTRDDDNGASDPTRKTAHQFHDISWRADEADIRELIGSSSSHLHVLGRAIKWTRSTWEK